MNKVFVYDPTASDPQSAVRGIGRYLQILRENFSKDFVFVSKIENLNLNKNLKLKIKNFVFINPFFNFLSPPLTLRRIAHKQIAVIHDLIPLKYPSRFPAGIKGSIYILLNKLALKNYDLIITDSEASKKDIVEKLKVKSQKVKVIYPCLPKSFLKFKVKNLDLNENLKFKIKNYILYVGDATWNKNLVNLAKAIKLANVNCVFVGKVFEILKQIHDDQAIGAASEETIREADCRDNRQSLAEEKRHERLNLAHPWQKELKKFYELAKDDKRIIFAGFIPDTELIKLYQQAMLNILPSRDEGFGFSWLEATNFSCPSLLSNIPVLKEISGGNALFCDPQNPQDIANKINQINSDKNLQNKIGTSAKKRSEYFSPEKFRTEFLSIL